MTIMDYSSSSVIVVVVLLLLVGREEFNFLGEYLTDFVQIWTIDANK